MTMHPDLKRRLAALVSQNGGDLFGVADLRPAHDFVVAQGGEAIGSWPRAVSVGIRLSDAIVDNHSPDEDRDGSIYLHHVYRVVTPALDFLARRVQRDIQAAGFDAFPVPASLYSRKTLRAVLSHKLAAHLAGLGWIGKSCLLVTPDYGPRVRWVTVLTDAPLATDDPLDRECGKCRVCVTACPVQAFKGIEFKPSEAVEVRFNTRACEEFRGTHACGLCVARCPVGVKSPPGPQKGR